MVWNGIKEKRHRLDESLYKGYLRCTFTAKLAHRDSYFVSASAFELHESILKEALTFRQCDSPLYLFMPDHLHVIIEGISDNSDVRACMIRYKQRSGYALSKATRGNVSWQKDFYDHILRDEEDYRRHLNYILMNPVRKGIVESWKEYRFWGSTVYDKEALRMGAKY